MTALSSFYPIYIDCCIESERQLRDAVEKEEKKERVRCPGCMEAHLWLLIASESAQRRVGQREETQADREKRIEAERQRKSLLAQKWAETKEGLLLQQRIEEDMIQKKQKLKADEAYARRKLLEDERYEWRDYLLEKKQEEGLVSRYCSIIDSIKAQEQLQSVQCVLERRADILEGKEASARLLHAEEESRCRSALKQRFASAIQWQNKLDADALTAMQLCEDNECKKTPTSPLSASGTCDFEKLRVADGIRSTSRAIAAERFAKVVDAFEEVVQKRFGSLCSREVGERRLVAEAEAKRFDALRMRFDVEKSVLLSQEQHAQELIELSASVLQAREDTKDAIAENRKRRLADKPTNEDATRAQLDELNRVEEAAEKACLRAQQLEEERSKRNAARDEDVEERRKAVETLRAENDRLKDALEAQRAEEIKKLMQQRVDRLLCAEASQRKKKEHECENYLRVLQSVVDTAKSCARDSENESKAEQLRQQEQQDFETRATSKARDSAGTSRGNHASTF